MDVCDEELMSLPANDVEPSPVTYAIEEDADDPEVLADQENSVVATAQTSSAFPTQGSFPSCSSSASKPSTSTVSSSLTPVLPTVTLFSSSGIIPKVHNVVATVDLNCKLDLMKIALRVRNCEYNPRRFHAVVARIQEPKTASLIFRSGKIIVTGARNESASHLATRKYARILQKIGFNIQFKNFKIQNLVASCDVRFPIQLERLYSNQVQFANYEPELFPGVIYRMVKPRMVLLIFVSGKLVMTGGKTRAQLNEAFENIYPILRNFRKQ